MFRPFLFSLLTFGALASPMPKEVSPELSARATCDGNTASDRSVWCDYDLSTNYYTDGPDTGETVEYWFEITNTTASPDGVSRMVLAVNGTVPGPTIEANWGDTIVVHVKNSMENNGTSIHWHGMRQNWTNLMDGVASVTQCPIAPGESATYTWKATQYGSSWYHSHFALQAWEGVFGPIIINGPASANYDEDLGPVILSDWSHRTADELYTYAETQGPPKLDNGLINGKNVYNDSGTIVGSRWETSVTSGSSYRLRITNAAIDSYFKFSIDNHTLTVIAMDLVPIVPYETTVLDITMGQRYDVVVNADQEVGDYWIRAIIQEDCSSNYYPTNVKGILRYDNSSTSDPTSHWWDWDDECVDEDVSDLVPYLSQTVGSLSTTNSDDDMPVTVGSVNSLFKWEISDISMAVEWADPTTLQVYNNQTTWEADDHVIELATADEWVYFVVQTTQGVPHPMHLHGHDFFILAQGTGSYNSSVTLNMDNPPRRDTATLSSQGYTVIAFQTDNPGAWLAHCHIGWHTSEGLALQFVERASEMASVIDYSSLNDTCSTWSSYADANGIVEEDSGI